MSILWKNLSLCAAFRQLEYETAHLLRKETNTERGYIVKTLAAFFGTKPLQCLCENPVLGVAHHWL